MNYSAIGELVAYFTVLLLLVKPLGSYMARIYRGETHGVAALLAPVERFIYRLSGIDPAAEMSWRGYAYAVLIFNALGAVVVYGLQRLQSLQPTAWLNPQQLGDTTPDLAFNTVTTHSEHSGKDLSYFDQAKNERWVPYVIEPAAGLTRSLMAFLVDAYHVEEVPNAKGGTDQRTVLKLDPRLAPVKAAVLPLSRNERLSPLAREVAANLRKYWNVDFDDAGAIGRRYRRQDEIGTPYAITVDFDSLDDNAVTVRDRDTMQQERVPLDELQSYLATRLVGA